MNADEQDSDQDDPRQRTPPTQAVVVDQDKAQKASRHAGDEKSKARKFVAKGWTAYKIASIVIQLSTLGVVAVYTRVTYRMWSVGQEANRRSRDSLAQAKNQFKVLRSDAAAAAKIEQDRFREQLGASKEQSEASRKQSAADAAASLRLASNSLDASRRALEYSQRAQVGPVGIDDFPLAGKPPLPERIKVRLRNTGRTTASGLLTTQSLIATLDSSPPDVEAQIIRVETNKHQSMATLGPGVDYFAFLDFSESVFVGRNREDIIQKRHWFLIGMVTYFDGFRQRKTTYCWENSGRPVDSWTACGSGNYAE